MPPSIHAAARAPRAAFWTLLPLLAVAGQPVLAQSPDTLCRKCDTDGICDSRTLPPTPPPGGGFEPREAMTDTDVQSVAIDVTLHFTNSTVSGTVTMVVKAVQPVSQFTLRAHSNFTVSATANGTPVTVGAPVNGRTRTITLDRTYAANEQFTLVLTYSGATAGGGFGSFTWGTHSGSPIASSLSEPYYAYTWWPCKDGDLGASGDNSDKFTLDMKVTVPGALPATPTTMQAPSNGALQSVTDLGDGTVRYHWTSGYAIPTYLVSFAATHYNTWTLTYTYPRDMLPDGTMPVEFYIYPESDTTGNRNAWGNVVNMLAAFRGAYGEYPFINEKYGIYQFPFNGGMEHQTMTGQGTFSESVTAHELAHQWWGDMITCKTWGDIWLNEGFATFSEAIWQERKPGGSSAAYHSWMANRRPNPATGSVYCYNTANVNSIFDGNTSYRKGGWVLHMLRHIMGDAPFFQALADYRAAYAYQSATTDDFAAVCATVHGQDLSWFFNEWVYETGQPDYDFASAPITVHGADYLLLSIHQKQSAAYGTYTMPLDIRYTAGGNTITRSVWNNDWTEYYVLKVPQGPPTSVLFDPQLWVLHPTPTAVSYVPGPPTVIDAAPPPGGLLAANTHPRTLSAVFHTNVTTQTSDYGLVGASAGAIPLALNYDAGTLTATLTTAAPLLPDHYTLTVGPEITAVNSGMTLDGELANPASAASFPSGDGQPGGAAVWTFDVTGHPADMDGNGVYNADDRAIFMNVLLGLDTDAAHVKRADFNLDDWVDGNDVAPFVAAIL